MRYILACKCAESNLCSDLCHVVREGVDCCVKFACADGVISFADAVDADYEDVCLCLVNCFYYAESHVVVVAEDSLHVRILDDPCSCELFSLLAIPVGVLLCDNFKTGVVVSDPILETCGSLAGCKCLGHTYDDTDLAFVAELVGDPLSCEETVLVCVRSAVVISDRDQAVVYVDDRDVRILCVLNGCCQVSVGDRGSHDSGNALVDSVLDHCLLACLIAFVCCSVYFDVDFSYGVDVLGCLLITFLKCSPEFVGNGLLDRCQVVAGLDRNFLAEFFTDLFDRCRARICVRIELACCGFGCVAGLSCCALCRSCCVCAAGACASATCRKTHDHRCCQDCR